MQNDIDSVSTNATTTEDDTASATIYDSAADLKITKTHNYITSYAPGSNVTFEILVNNVGNLATVGTSMITDILPSGLSFVSATGTGWTCQGTSNISCSRYDVLAPGMSFAPVMITANISATSTLPITNTARVSSFIDYNPANDTATDTVNVYIAPAPGSGINVNVGGGGSYTGPSIILPFVIAPSVSSAINSQIVNTVTSQVIPPVLIKTVAAINANTPNVTTAKIKKVIRKRLADTGANSMYIVLIAAALLITLMFILRKRKEEKSL